MASKKINPFSKSNPDTGFGTQPTNVGGRFLNKDGSFNLKKQGIPFSKRTSFYSFLLELSWFQFLGVIVLCYLFFNLVFTAIYLLIGYEQLQGFHSTTDWGRIKEVFYFSTQTFTTVGYGRINPVSDGADSLASLETMSGWLFFAIVTGLLYGRFTRPRAYIDFSENVLISPYKNIAGVMFRMVPYKTSHHLSDVRVAINLSLKVMENGKEEYRFYQLPLERAKIDMFNMNWTVVHPINEESPLLNFTKEDLDTSDIEMMVQVTGFDTIYSNVVMARTSYTYDEFVWGAKFKPMYHESEDGTTTILDLDKLNDYDKVNIETAMVVQMKKGNSMMETEYEQQAFSELRVWQKKMQRMPSLINKLSKKLQVKVNSYIPEKVHKVITTSLKQMIKGVLFGAKITTRNPVAVDSLQATEEALEKLIKNFRHTAAAEGGITGAGGILLGLADFPILLGIKLKMLFDIAALYGFDVKDYKERVYILHIFELAFSSQQHRQNVYAKMFDWDNKKQQFPDDINQFDWRSFQQEYRDYIDLAKMAQLIPGIGAVVGVVVNYKLINQLGKTAMNAYRMRLFKNAIE